MHPRYACKRPQFAIRTLTTHGTVSSRDPRRRGTPRPADRVPPVALDSPRRAVTGGANGEEHFLRWVEPGEAVGMATVLTESPIQMDLISSGDSQALWIGRELVLEVLRSDAEAGIAVARFLSARLSEAVDLLAARSQLRLDDRLLTALQHFAQRNGEPWPEGRVRLLLTQEDLARAVDASRQRVNQALKRLQTQGMVELGYRCIDIRRWPV